MTSLTVARPAVTATTAGAGDPVATAIAFARAQIGKPYRWGAAGPDAYDCSGLVQSAYKAAGVALPRTTAGMITVGTPVAKADLRPGDLIFPDPGHVQLYSGGGMQIEAAKPGTQLREVPMWGFMTARRVAGDGGTATSPLPVVGAVVDVANSLSSDIAGAIGNLLGLGTLANDVRKVALQIAFVGAGIGLVLLGASRAAAAPVQKAIGALT
jgi:hypothetical protein